MPWSAKQSHPKSWKRWLPIKSHGYTNPNAGSPPPPNSCKAFLVIKVHALPHDEIRGPRKFVSQGAMRDHSVASVQLTVMKARGQAMSNGSSLPLSNLQHFPDPRQPLGKVRIILNLRLNASNDASCRAVRFYLELPCYFLKVFPSERSCQIHRDISRLIRDSPPDCKQIRVFDSIICRNGCLDGFNGDRREHFRFRHFRAHFCSEEALIYCLDEFRTSKDGRKFFQ